MKKILIMTVLAAMCSAAAFAQQRDENFKPMDYGFVKNAVVNTTYSNIKTAISEITPMLESEGYEVTAEGNTLVATASMRRGPQGGPQGGQQNAQNNSQARTRSQRQNSNANTNAQQGGRPPMGGGMMGGGMKPSFKATFSLVAGAVVINVTDITMPERPERPESD